jgi:hypothetical protein
MPTSRSAATRSSTPRRPRRSRPRSYASMDEKFAKFGRLQSGGALRGADHPMSQYAMEYGKQMHDDYARSASGARVRPALRWRGRAPRLHRRRQHLLRLRVQARHRQGEAQRAVAARPLCARGDDVLSAAHRRQGRATTARSKVGITLEVERQCMSGGRVAFKDRSGARIRFARRSSSAPDDSRSLVLEVRFDTEPATWRDRLLPALQPLVDGRRPSRRCSLAAPGGRVSRDRKVQVGASRGQRVDGDDRRHRAEHLRRRRTVDHQALPAPQSGDRPPLPAAGEPLRRD